jgi:hypothetical protein
MCSDDTHGGPIVLTVYSVRIRYGSPSRACRLPDRAALCIPHLLGGSRADNARLVVALTHIDMCMWTGLPGPHLPPPVQGWTANYARLGPQTVIIFLISETMRHSLGLEGL